MATITVHLLNGESIDVDRDLCETFTDVKAQIAIRIEKFIPHILLLSSDQSTVLDDDENTLGTASASRKEERDISPTAASAIPSSLYTIVREDEEFTSSPTTASYHMWMHVVELHAQSGDLHGLTRALELMREQPDMDPYGILNCMLCRLSCTDGTSVTEWMLENGANVNCIDGRGNTPLLNAIMCDKEPMVRQFLAYGADVNVCNNSGWSPMTLAASKGRRSIIDDLLSRDGDINGMDAFGITALCAAVERGHSELSIWMVKERKADVNLAAHLGVTALKVAIDQRDGKIAAKLIRVGANPHGTYGTPAQTLVQIAQERGGSIWEYVNKAVSKENGSVAK